MSESRNQLSIEIPALVAVLVGGAVLRYWLSTAIPFDASEFAALSEASVRDHGLRVPFIMFNGLSLFALYLLMRRAAGVQTAFALLLTLLLGIRGLHLGVTLPERLEAIRRETAADPETGSESLKSHLCRVYPVG